MSLKLVILDRDGVINQESAEYVKTPQAWQPIDGSLEAIARLNEAGFKVAVATNQAGVARGLFTEDALALMHEKMHRLLAEKHGVLDAVYQCIHGPDEGCSCRKPKPGMLKQALSDFEVQAQEACFIGDSLRDIMAAQAAGCKPVLVLTGNGKKTSELPQMHGVACYECLGDFVDVLLKDHGGGV